MIQTVEIKKEPTEIVKCTNEHFAVIQLSFTNKTDTTTYINVYIVPAGKSCPKYDKNTGELVEGDESTIYLKNVKLLPNETLVLNQEKFLLSVGDAIYANAIDDNQVSCTVVYEVY